MKKALCSLSILLIIIACGPKKDITDASGEARNIRSLEKQLKAKKNDLKALSGVMSVGYQTAEESIDLRVNYRIKKDSAIWMSAKVAGLIPVAKALITPDKVSFYQKLNNEYFEGDYTLINDLLGIPVKYEQLENLLLGKPILDPFTKKSRFSQDETSFFVSNDDDEQFSYQTAWLKKKLALQVQRIDQKENDQQLLIHYDRYETYQGTSLPIDFFILASNIGSQVRIDIQIKKVQLMDDVRLPFTIPDGYSKMNL